MTYAGDLTPQQTWDFLAEHPDAALVDVRTDAEWRYVGVPDTSSLGRRPALIEWSTYPSGQPNPDFVASLAAVGPATRSLVNTSMPPASAKYTSS